MNKKILFLVLLATVLVLPILTQAAVPAELTNALDGIKDAIIAVGTALIVIGFVVAGIIYLLSAGSPERMGTAKKALMAAMIGAAIVVLAMGAGVMQGIVKGILGIP